MVALDAVRPVSYRRQQRSGGRNMPFLLLSVALSILLIGFLCLIAAIYVTSAIGAIDAPAGGQLFGNLLVEPFVMLFRGGAATLVGGCLLAFCGGFMMIFSN
jgi:hypothetical protein